MLWLDVENYVRRSIQLVLELISVVFLYLIILHPTYIVCVWHSKYLSKSLE